MIHRTLSNPEQNLFLKALHYVPLVWPQRVSSPLKGCCYGSLCNRELPTAHIKHLLKIYRKQIKRRELYIQLQKCIYNYKLALIRRISMYNRNFSVEKQGNSKQAGGRQRNVLSKKMVCPEQKLKRLREGDFKVGQKIKRKRRK